MALTKGVLKKLGPGTVSLGAHSWVAREYIDVGDQHIRKTVTSRYLDDALEEAVQSDGEVRLGILRNLMFLGRRTIASVRSPDGCVRRLGIGVGLAASFVLLVTTAFYALPVLIVVGFSADALAGEFPQFREELRSIGSGALVAYLALVLALPLQFLARFLTARRAA